MSLEPRPAARPVISRKSASNRGISSQSCPLLSSQYTGKKPSNRCIPFVLSSIEGVWVTGAGALPVCANTSAVPAAKNQKTNIKMQLSLYTIESLIQLGYCIALGDFRTLQQLNNLYSQRIQGVRNSICLDVDENIPF